MPDPTPRATARQVPASARGALDDLAHAWRQRRGRSSTPRLYFSPGRVNLMGAHLDYNGGPVMPVAIDRGTFIALAPRSDSRLRVASLVEPGECEIELAAAARPERSGAWFDYPLGVALAMRGARLDLPGLDVLYGGNLPIGGGLSSSASICVGTALALERAWGLQQTPLARIDAALWAEREYVGVKCGVMDPTSIGLARKGHLLWLDCKDRSTEHLPLDDERLLIGVADSGVRRELARGDFNRRVEECRAAFAALRVHAPEATCLRDIPLHVLDAHGDALDPLVAQRARHVLEEVARTCSARAALLQGDLHAFGAAMVRTHASLRELFDVSLPELDLLAEVALSIDGVYGARLTGAGFGGCVVILLHPRARHELAPRLQQAFAQRFGRVPDVKLYASSDGPREVASG